MLLYLFYNADLLDVARGPDEKSLSYVDDVAFMAMANSFTQMHRILKSMMLWAQGGFRWSKAHNSNFKTSKSVLMDLSRSKSAIHPPLSIRGMTIATVSTHKFLGVMYAGSGAPVGASGQLRDRQSHHVDISIL